MTYRLYFAAPQGDGKFCVDYEEHESIDGDVIPGSRTTVAVDLDTLSDADHEARRRQVRSYAQPK